MIYLNRNLSFNLKFDLETIDLDSIFLFFEHVSVVKTKETRKVLIATENIFLKCSLQ